MCFHRPNQYLAAAFAVVSSSRAAVSCGLQLVKIAIANRPMAATHSSTSRNHWADRIFN